MKNRHPKNSLRVSARTALPIHRRPTHFGTACPIYIRSAHLENGISKSWRSDSKPLFRYFYYFYNTISRFSKHTWEKPDLFKDELKLHYQQVSLIGALPSCGSQYMKSVKKCYES